MAVSDQARHQIHKEVLNASMTSMLDLRYVLELVIYGLDDERFLSISLSVRSISRLYMFFLMGVMRWTHS